VRAQNANSLLWADPACLYLDQLQPKPCTELIGNWNTTW